MVVTLIEMTGTRAPLPAEPPAHPLRAALARGDALHARSDPALLHILAAQDRSLLSEAVVAQVDGLLIDLSAQLVKAFGREAPTTRSIGAMQTHLLQIAGLRAHCQALALEWRLAVRLEAEQTLDPVLSPLIQTLVGHDDAMVAALAMAALSAQARFAQAQRRMELPLGELTADLFHAVLVTARESLGGDLPDEAASADARLRAAYDEGASRVSLMTRLVAIEGALPRPMPTLDEAGVALWLTSLASRTGEDRDRTACAVADPMLGRLLLTLRAAGVAPLEAERQTLRAHPDAVLPRGLQDIGTREAAQWLAEARG